MYLFVFFVLYQASVAVFSHDNTLVVTGEQRGKPKLWDLLSKRLIHALPHGDDDFAAVCL